jgi:4-phospho-D-threonate 3-dehydrogenase / 4-phospho-D-erythronate 3-dehydrogenase
MDTAFKGGTPVEKDHRPIIAVTMGDPAGVGPEICARTFADESVLRESRPVLYGDARVMRKAVALVGADLEVRVIDNPAAATGEAGILEIVNFPNADPAMFRPGEVSALCGRAAWEYIEAAGRAALARKIAAVVTAPINKESIAAAKVPYIGHTEMFGAIAGIADPLTMFETLSLRVFFLTRHVPLRKACELVTRNRLIDYLERCSAALADLGLPGSIAVAGLNPHCGEHGLFGDDEGREIEPAIEEATRRGLPVVGPIGADSVFHLAKSGRYAAVLSLYHDQGHIACKTLDFEKTVSLTLGLPFLRTSVDHGTAFNLAWKATARAVSLIEAMLAAARYAPTFAASAHNS